MDSTALDKSARPTCDAAVRPGPPEHVTDGSLTPPDVAASAVGGLIVFEGPDATGKSTLIAAVAAWLDERAVDFEVHAFPGNITGSLGELVYRIHHDPRAVNIDAITPSALQALHVAAHLDAIERRIVPALRAGRLVLLDRFWWSTWAYGVVDGVETNLLESLISIERRAWGEWRPAAVVLPRRPSAWLERPALAAAYGELAERSEGEHAVFAVDASSTRERALAELIARLPLLSLRRPRGAGQDAAKPRRPSPETT